MSETNNWNNSVVECRISYTAMYGSVKCLGLS